VKIWRHGEEGFTQMHKDNDMKNGVRVKMHFDNGEEDHGEIQR
jgi:hypothetical protein